LAALGALRLLTWATDDRVRLSFHPATATARLTGPFTTVEEVADELAAMVGRMGPQQTLPGISRSWPPPSSSGPDPMRVARSAYRDLAARAGEAAQPWLSCIATDLAVDNESKSRCALTPFMAPAGRQNVATFFTKPLEYLRGDAEPLYEALASWRRVDGYTGEYFDHRAIRGAGDLPSGKATNAGVPGASWLATQALPLLHLTGDGQDPQTALWHRLGRRGVMCWPVWEPELDLAAARALITHPVLTRLRPDPQDSGTLEIEADRLRPLGVIVAAAAERRAMPNSAGPLVPLPVRLI
jgi:CRISPR-associated endonuclease/helicase Cas3